MATNYSVKLLSVPLTITDRQQQEYFRQLNNTLNNLNTTITELVSRITVLEGKV